MHQHACVDTISNPYIGKRLAILIGNLWRQHGGQAIEWERAQERPPLRPNPKLDEVIEKVLRAG